MPRKPKKPCKFLGCPNLTSGNYCNVHAKIACDNYNRFERSPDVNKRYGRDWKSIRARYVALHPLCEMCLKEGRLTPVEEVHHKKPVSQGGTNDFENLMSLCKSCHTKIHCNELHDR